MKHRLWLVLLFVSVALLFAGCTTLLPHEEIAFGNDESFEVMSSTESQYIVVHGVGTLNRKAKEAIEKAGGVVINEIPQIGVTVVSSSNPGFAATAKRISGVSFVGEDLMLSLDLPETRLAQEDISVEGIEDNDLYMAYQWDIRRVGGNADTWAIEKGAGAIVAVLDTGVYAAHPDIAPNYAYGKDFTDITVELPPGWIMWDQGGPQDYEGHGTHVAGSIAAAITSGRIIGVAPEASIANYKVMVAVITNAGVATGTGYQSWIIDGIVAAADDGVNVINMSLGGWRFMNEPGGAAAYVAYLRATQYARKRGVLVVASSGNDGVDLGKVRPAFHVPSGTPAAISVNATGPDDSLAFYSNYGAADTRVVGPGGDISAPPFSYCLSAYSPLNAWAPGAGWVFTIGTSMAAPKVAGVAALIYAQNPGITPSQVEARLAQTAEDLGKRGFDPYFGHGIVNAYRALTNQRK